MHGMVQHSISYTTGTCIIPYVLLIRNTITTEGKHVFCSITGCTHARYMYTTSVVYTVYAHVEHIMSISSSSIHAGYVCSIQGIRYHVVYHDTWVWGEHTQYIPYHCCVGSTRYVWSICCVCMYIMYVCSVCSTPPGMLCREDAVCRYTMVCSTTVAQQHVIHQYGIPQYVIHQQ